MAEKTEEQLWWEEDARRLNALSEAAKDAGVAVPIEEDLPDDEETEN